MTPETKNMLTLRLTLQHIIDADWRAWDELSSPEEFVTWAKSRAQHAIDTVDANTTQQAEQAREAVAYMVSHPETGDMGPWRFKDQAQIDDMLRRGHTLKPLVYAAPAQQEAAGAKVWIVLDEDDNPIYCAGWPEACHEHINDAISEHDIEEAAKWKVRSATLDSASLPSPAPQKEHSRFGSSELQAIVLERALAKSTPQGTAQEAAAPAVPSEREAELMRLVDELVVTWVEDAEPPSNRRAARKALEDAIRATLAPAPREMEEVSDEEINRIAREMGWVCATDRHIAFARALLAHSRTATPPGYVLVPKEPTPEMIDRGRFEASVDVFNDPETGLDANLLNAGDVFKAMIAAAPSADKQGEQT